MPDRPKSDSHSGARNRTTLTTLTVWAVSIETPSFSLGMKQDPLGPLKLRGVIQQLAT